MTWEIFRKNLRGLRLVRFRVTEIAPTGELTVVGSSARRNFETCEAEGRLLKEFARAPPREIPIRRKCTGRGPDRILDILQGLRPVRLILRRLVVGWSPFSRLLPISGLRVDALRPKMTLKR